LSKIAQAKSIENDESCKTDKQNYKAFTKTVFKALRIKQKEFLVNVIFLLVKKKVKHVFLVWFGF
jgi:hypothetical protein